MGKAHLLLCLLITWLARADDFSMNLLDSSLGLELAQFEVDLSSERGQQITRSLAADQHVISLDSFFAEPVMLTTRSTKLNGASSERGRHLVGDHGRMLWNTTQESQVCKACIDNGFIWCPTASKSSGYCCEKTENCPRAGGCSTDYQLLEFQYMLCPNEAGCMFSRELSPPNDDTQKLYENLKGKFLLGDVCSFKVSIPSSADLNDMMYIRVEYLQDCTATLIKGVTFD